MIRHVFLWNVKPEAGPDAGQRILDALERLKGGAGARALLVASDALIFAYGAPAESKPGVLES